MSKAALNALTRMLLYELRADGVLVNARVSWWTNTDIGRGGRPGQRGRREHRVGRAAVSNT